MSPVAQTSPSLPGQDAPQQTPPQPHVNGGGGDGRDTSSGAAAGANGHSSQQQPQQTQPQQQSQRPASASSKKNLPGQKDSYWFAQGDNKQSSNQQTASMGGPNDQLFGEGDSSGVSFKDREDRVRHLRERQQLEKQQKLEELKEQAAAAQRFREQQENERRRRLDEMRLRDADRRSQVEERKRIIQQAEQDRREAVLRKTAEREQRLETKRRNERSSIVFAFGSSTPRMLDPRDSNSASYWSSRRATSTTNVHLTDTSINRRASECSETDLSRKRATSAHGLDRKPDDLRMSSSMYEVFHWDESSSSQPNHPPTTQGEDLMTRSMTAAIPATAARRRTDLMPALPSAREGSYRSSPRHRSPGRALSLGRLDELSRPKQRQPPLAPLHETSPSSVRMTPPARTMSKSMSHLAPRPARPHGLDAKSGQLDRGASRSSVTLAQPRMTRAEMLRQKKLQGGASSSSSRTTRTSGNPTGMRSGTVTPNSPSRPTSALSQGSTNSSQVSLRARTSPRKPRPLSIAGSSISSADKPKDGSDPRESRPMERKLSVGSASSVTKPTRAKSVSSDRSAPATPARTPSKAATPKKTPAQVKAESAAKKAVEKSKATPKAKITPKTTPLQSPSTENIPLPGTKDKKPSPTKEEKSKGDKIKEKKPDNGQENGVEATPAVVANGTDAQKAPLIKEMEKSADVKIESADITVESADVKVESAGKHVEQGQAAAPLELPVAPEPVQQDKVAKEQVESKDNVEKVEGKSEEKSKPSESVEEITDSGVSQDKLPVGDKAEEQEKSLAQRAAEKPITGYATEEDYKAAMAEKRRLAREAKEREQELERQRQLAEEERERREEEEYLMMVENQRKAEEERLRKAIEEADRTRKEEAKRKEEEEKQREEAERLEQQKKKETEERLRKEEEERQMRKSRVAAIMARTRGKGGSNTPTKGEAKTPSEDGKNFDEGLMSASMTDSMISAAEEGSASKELAPTAEAPTDPPADASPQSVQPDTEATSHTAAVTTVESSTSSVIQEVTHSSVEVTTTQSNVVEDIISGVSTMKVEVPQVNGDSPVPMDTTPTQSVDLLGTLSTVHSVNHNGIDNTSQPTSQGTENLLGSLDPLNSSLTTTTTTTTTPAASNFEQIIDLGQTKLSNEDAVNSNPPSPFIAFEQNLNKKQQENTNSVPDLLL